MRDIIDRLIGGVDDRGAKITIAGVLVGGAMVMKATKMGAELARDGRIAADGKGLQGLGEDLLSGVIPGTERRTIHLDDDRSSPGDERP